MAAKVGTKGQVVIEKAIRDRLGIEPGWIALQRLVDDHIEIHFIPPEHNRSLAGCLAPYTNVRVSPEEWHDVAERAVEEAARDDWLGREW
jgi:AbrB family looped-hinge helix DNA binding protein